MSSSIDLYAVTASVDGHCWGAFLIAKDADDATTKASARLVNGEIKNVIRICDYRSGTLRRNGLSDVDPGKDVVFSQDALFELVAYLHRSVTALTGTIQSLTGMVVSKLDLRQFTFRVIVGLTGEVQLHELFARDEQEAREEAEKFAKSEYHPESIVSSLVEVET